MARSGRRHRYLFCGNCKTDSYQSNASSYMTNCRFETEVVDKDPINNSRCLHHVAGLGYIKGMGTQIWDPFDQDDESGDYVVVPMAPAIDISQWSHIEPVNGRVCYNDGNTAVRPTELDRVQDVYTNNPWGTVGLSEAQIILGSRRHPLWSYQEVQQGAYKSYLQAKTPLNQFKVGIDSFYRPVDTNSMHKESNVAIQGRQYHDNVTSPLAFKTLNRGFYGENENSSNAFQDLLNIATVREDQGMILMDPTTCQVSTTKTDNYLIETGMRKKFKPDDSTNPRKIIPVFA